MRRGQRAQRGVGRGKRVAARRAAPFGHVFDVNPMMKMSGIDALRTVINEYETADDPFVQLSEAQRLQKILTQIRMRDTEGVRYLIESGGRAFVDVINNTIERTTPLIQAVLVGIPQIVALLINSGAATNQPGQGGNTAVHQAAMRDRFEIIEILHKAGGDLNRKNDAGDTALHLIVRECYQDVNTLIAMVELFWDPLIPNNEGELPFDMIEDKDVVNQLLNRSFWVRSRGPFFLRYRQPNSLIAKVSSNVFREIVLLIQMDNKAYSTFFRDSLMFPIPKSAKRKTVNNLRKHRSVKGGSNSSLNSQRSSASMLIHSLQRPKPQFMTMLPGAFNLDTLTSTTSSEQVRKKRTVNNRWSNSLATPSKILTTCPSPVSFALSSYRGKTTIWELDIHSISDNGNLTPAVVDSYFSLVKQLNRRAMLRGQAVDKVLMYSTAVSSRIFFEDTPISLRINLFHYDILFFPLRYKSFWVLLSVNLQDKTASVFNPSRKAIDTEDILVRLFQFIGNQHQKFIGGDIGLSTFRNINYQDAPCDKFGEEDSGIFICKQVEILSKGGIGKVESTLIYEYRNDVLDKIIKLS